MWNVLDVLKSWGFIIQNDIVYEYNRVGAHLILTKTLRDFLRKLVFFMWTKSKDLLGS